MLFYFLCEYILINLKKNNFYKMEIEENLSLKNEIKNAAIEVGSTSTCHGKKKRTEVF